MYISIARWYFSFQFNTAQQYIVVSYFTDFYSYKNVCFTHPQHHSATVDRYTRKCQMTPRRARVVNILREQYRIRAVYLVTPTSV